MKIIIELRKKAKEEGIEQHLKEINNLWSEIEKMAETKSIIASIDMR